jgi:hypothetical protein
MFQIMFHPIMFADLFMLSDFRVLKTKLSVIEGSMEAAIGFQLVGLDKQEVRYFVRATILGLVAFHHYY